MPPISQRHSSRLSPEFALLGFLDQSPAYGYELLQRLVNHLGHVWHISLSQVYNILNRLEAQGLVVGIVQEQEKHPDRRLFHVTDTGHKHFEAWLNTGTRSSLRSIRLEFLTRLFFLYARQPESALQKIEEQITALQKDIPDLEDQLAAIQREYPFNRLGASLYLRNLVSVIEWLEECKLSLHSNP